MLTKLKWIFIAIVLTIFAFSFIISFSSLVLRDTGIETTIELIAKDLGSKP